MIIFSKSSKYQNPDCNTIFSQHKAIELYLNKPCISFISNDILPKSFSDEDFQFLSNLINSLTINHDSIGLILHFFGGSLNAGCSLSNFIREKFTNIDIYIPFFALSTGTLISLNADIIYTNPSAHFSPLDPQMSGNIDSSNEKVVSSPQTIKGYLSILTDWLEVNDNDSKMEAFKALSTYFHPASLGKIAQIEAQITNAAVLALEHSLPNSSNAEHRRIVSALVNFPGGHDALIFGNDIKKLGLNVSFLDNKLNFLLKNYIKSVQQILNYTPKKHILSPRSTFIMTSTCLLAEYMIYPETISFQKSKSGNNDKLSKLNKWEIRYNTL